jgi:pimeloyl-ACP methyl ester carboxylesterase
VEPAERFGTRTYSYGDCVVTVGERVPRPPVGARATLLFLHGRFAPASSWLPVADRLSDRYRCVLVDFAEAGASSFQRLGGLTSSLAATLGDLPRVAVGEDTGAALAQLCALEAEARLDGLVLLNAASPAEPLPALFSRPLARLRALFSRSGGVRSAAQALEESWPGFHERRAWTEALSGYRRPVLLLWGRTDPLALPERAARLARIFPESEHFEYETVERSLATEAPEWTAAKMRAFLFGIETLTSGRRSLSR